MEPLPEDFLRELAREKDLTELQTEVFVAQYLNPKGTQANICESLPGVDLGAYKTRLSEVYRKFGFGNAKGQKKRKVYQSLLERRSLQSSAETDQNLSLTIDQMVERVREQVKPDIIQRCGTMRVLDMAQPVGLGEIYTDVNILAKVSRTSRKDLAQIQEMVGLDLDDFERFSFGDIAKERVAGLEVVKEHRKLMIWGKPGAGKTTFLKHLAMSCIWGELFPELVPFFVTIKSFAEENGQPNLFTYLQAQAEMHGVEPGQLKEIINAGRAMILLDGLDEVRQEDSRRVIKGIQDFADLWRDNFFAITCRIAAKEYMFQGGFTEVEVADFDQDQIACFVNNWFRCKGEEKKAEEFINALKNQKPIQELASIPILLTLLCLVFEEESRFPENRGDLFTEGIKILLKQWDEGRAIQRDEIYKNLTVKRREQMLSEIAFKTFEKGEYFFKQNRVENLILEFIQNLPDAKNDPEALRLDSEEVLKAIEAQHGILVERAKGIYSFSHLTFQEYLAAQFLANRPKAHPVIQENFDQKRWREVILFVFGEIDDGDIASQLAINLRQWLDRRIVVDPKHQEFLFWLHQKERSIDVEYSPADYQEIANRILNASLLLNSSPPLSRALYLDLDLYPYLSLDLSLDLSLYNSLDLSLGLYHSLSRVFSPTPSLFISRSVSLNFYRSLSLSLERAQQLNLSYVNVFQGLKNELPTPDQKDKLEHWWKVNGKDWTKRLRQAMIEHRNIGHDWQWTKTQEETLKNYWDGNRFLLECLCSAYICRDVREWIENTMFLPMSELEKVPPPEI